MKIIFGPVSSRRLGRSLGIDLTPYKTCNMDCIYCECGKKTNLTNSRKNFYNLQEVLSELDTAIKDRSPIDYITLSGSGEPSLYKDIKPLISTVKKKYPNIKFAVLTNTSLITDPEVFDAFLEADIVLPSIDSVLEEGFKKINRPHPELNISKILDGLLEFKKVFKGKIWLEIFICPGLNDSEKELNALADYAKKLDPDRVQINTLDRPGVESWLKPLDPEGFDRVTLFFKGLNIETISRKLIKEIEQDIEDSNSNKSRDSKKILDNSEDLLISTLKRRPLTKNDIMALSAWGELKAQKWIEESLLSGILSSKESENGDVFFSLNIKS
jgi:wyosine [tRNA(Phe)-imidazoG37] synthetase (radical SAM superfamily)